MSSSSKEGFMALAGTLMGLGVITVGLRFYARRRQQLPLKADDWLALLGLISYIGGAITVFISVHTKVLGYSASDFTPAQKAAKAKTSSVIQIALDVFTTTVLACVKLSALFFYRRIFRSRSLTTWFDYANNATIVIVILWLFVFQFLTGFQCGTHFSALWDGTYLQYCTISFPFLYGLAISDFLLDLWILALPIPRIMQLNTTRAKKLSIIGIFLLAFVGLGASIARMVQYLRIEIGGYDYLFHTDEERLLTQAFYLTMLEAGMSLVAVNLPTLWGLMTLSHPNKIVNRMMSLFTISSTGSERVPGTHDSRDSRRRGGGEGEKKQHEIKDESSLRVDSVPSRTSPAHSYNGELKHDLESQK